MIQFENITKKFQEDYILKNFNYSIEPGEKVLITGKSGIGKSTLFRLLLGFEQADTGVIRINGSVLDGNTVWELRKQLAFVSQDTALGQGRVSNLFNDTLSIKANLHLKSKSFDKLNEYLELFELNNEILNKNLETISGGERQRIAIVNSLLLDRKIFLLDEFTSSLDALLKKKVADYFFGNDCFTVLAISHDAIDLKEFNVKLLNMEKS